MCLFFSCHWCHSIAKVTSVTWHFYLSLHGDVLIISELYTSCNEWHEFLNLEKKRLHEFLKRLDVSPKTSATLLQLFFNNFKCFFNCYCYKLFLWLSSRASRRICKALVNVFFALLNNSSDSSRCSEWHFGREFSFRHTLILWLYVFHYFINFRISL